LAAIGSLVPHDSISGKTADVDMGMFTRVTPPRLPSAPTAYSEPYMSGVLNVLYLFFQQINGVQSINVAELNLDLNTLPTQADLATLRLGDVFRDTTTGSTSQVLRIKTS